jgi:site-specific recombinase XerD
MSPHTLHSYRDSLSLLLRFVGSEKKCSVVALDIKDMTSDRVISFLQYLEEKRENSSSTRNVRLAAIHSFFRFLAEKYPDQLEHCQRVLAIPFKRTRSRPIEYLEHDEIRAILSIIDRSTRDGRRDHALLVTLFNTGARVQEILDLRATDLQLIKPFHARLFGKGKKERLCPLWSETAQVIHALLDEQGVDPRSPEQVFRNHRGQPLTRYGVRYLLAKYCGLACKSTPTLRGKRLHPHSMRHSTAVHLLKAGVDMTTISHWLGHNSVETTNKYAAVDLDMKREAIRKIAHIGKTDGSPTAPWRKDASILSWLESL